MHVSWDINPGLSVPPLLSSFKVQHFADDDTNQLYLCNWTKKLNKLVITDLKHLVNWLNGSKLSCTVKESWHGNL